MNNERRENMEIDLQKLLLSYLDKWWLIAICTAVAGLLALLITTNFVTPMYRSEVMIYVNNNRAGQGLDTVTNANLVTSQRLVGTYIEIIETDSVLEKVAEASELSVTAAKIRSAMQAQQVGNTELFTVSISHADPEKAAQLVNALAKVAPGEIERIVEGSSAKVIDYGKVPTKPSSPNRRNSTILGALVGVVLAVLYITLRFLLDVRVKEEEDLYALFDIPVLAHIPDFSPEKSSKHRSGYEKSVQAYVSAAEKGVTEK